MADGSKHLVTVALSVFDVLNAVTQAAAATFPGGLRGGYGRWRQHSGENVMKSGLLREIFSDKKTIDNRALNLLGAQVIRSIAARVVRNRRSFPVDYKLQDELEELEREGIVTWPDFLSPDDFEAVRRECLNLVARDGGLPFLKFGPNTVGRIGLANAGTDQLWRFFADKRLQNLLEMSERRPLGDLSAIACLEHLIQGPAQEFVDPELELHSDIFFTTHKVWFYLSDVRLESGPLAFVKRSHWLTPQCLYYIYKESCTRALGANKSRRISLHEKRKFGDETVVTCPRNTLVVANTCGYHRRVQGMVGGERLSLHFQLRANPFG